MASELLPCFFMSNSSECIASAGPPQSTARTPFQNDSRLNTATGSCRPEPTRASWALTSMCGLRAANASRLAHSCTAGHSSMRLTSKAEWFCRMWKSNCCCVSFEPS